MAETREQYLACGRGADVVTVLSLDYRGERLRICPQHLPVLIHKPAELANKLPGLENLPPVQH